MGLTLAFKWVYHDFNMVITHVNINSWLKHGLICLNKTIRTQTENQPVMRLLSCRQIGLLLPVLAKSRPFTYHASGNVGERASHNSFAFLVSWLLADGMVSFTLLGGLFFA